MNPQYLVVKTDGTVYMALRKEDLLGLTNTALRLELHPGMGFGKIFTIGGSAGAYTAANNNHTDGYNNQHAKSF
jgi:hypothetical protein